MSPFRNPRNDPDHPTWWVIGALLLMLLVIEVVHCSAANAACEQEMKGYFHRYNMVNEKGVLVHRAIIPPECPWLKEPDVPFPPSPEQLTGTSAEGHREGYGSGRDGYYSAPSSYYGGSGARSFGSFR